MQNSKTIPCTFFARGRCRFGDRCRFMHGTATTTDEPLEPLDDVKIAAVTLPNEPIFTNENPETELSCCICFETVSAANNKSFGLVSGCDHSFCLSCLREWRYSKSNASDATKQCPVCRVAINYVVPCTSFLTGDEKEQFIKSHFEKMSQKPCKHFKAERGTCPFGQECYFAHLGQNGEDMKPTDFKKKQRSPRHISSIERDLVLLSRLLNHRMRFPFSLFDDGDDFEDEDDEDNVSFFAGYMDEDEDEYFEDDDDDEEDEDDDDDDESIPPLVH